MRHVLLVVAVAAAKKAATPRFSVIVDAGSTGSRVYVYEKVEGAELSGSRGAKAAPGLAAFADDVGGVAAHLAPFIRFARERVPEAEWPRTPFRIYATAGMRLVARARAAAVYDACFAALAPSGFRVARRDLRTISGEDEAFFAGLAANYAMGSVDGDARRVSDVVFGALDLGGASTQIAAPARAPTGERLRAGDFSVATFLGYGVERAHATSARRRPRRDGAFRRARL